MAVLRGRDRAEMALLRRRLLWLFDSRGYLVTLRHGTEDSEHSRGGDSLIHEDLPSH